MAEKDMLRPARCTARTAAGKACTYPAAPGSNPPLCDLHGRNWLEALDKEGRFEFYGRYLTRREDQATLAQMAQPSRVRELIVARALVAHLLDELQGFKADPAAYKSLVPLILRSLKLASDLAKQLEGAGQDEDWEGVLDRLGDELDVDL